MRSDIMPVRAIALACIVAAAQPALAQAPSTATFMNAMTVCGAGVSVTIDANLKGSLQSLYEGESTQGRAVQEIIPKIADQLPKGDNYQKYVECLDKFLSR